MAGLLYLTFVLDIIHSLCGVGGDIFFYCGELCRVECRQNRTFFRTLADANCTFCNSQEEGTSHLLVFLLYLPGGWANMQIEVHSRQYSTMGFIYAYAKMLMA